MKTKHTPGPWHYIYDNPSDEDLVIYTGDYDNTHTLISEVFADGSGVGGFSERKIPLPEEALANAKVMVAGPEMLEALRGAKQALELFADGYNVSSEIAAATEAIKKATE